MGWQRLAPRLRTRQMVRKSRAGGVVGYHHCGRGAASALATTEDVREVTSSRSPKSTTQRPLRLSPLKQGKGRPRMASSRLLETECSPCQLVQQEPTVHIWPARGSSIFNAQEGGG